MPHSAKETEEKPGSIPIFEAAPKVIGSIQDRSIQVSWKSTLQFLYNPVDKQKT